MLETRIKSGKITQASGSKWYYVILEWLFIVKISYSSKAQDAVLV